MAWLDRDGVSLFYDEADGADTLFLFVHGIACDHTYLKPQFEYFARLGHRVVSVDLRGHGQSDAPECDYTMGLFADDLAWMCGQLGLEKPVVVGHSLGGEISLALAVASPDLPSAVVLMDSTIMPPQWRTESMRPFIDSLRTPDYSDELRKYFLRLFLPTDDQGRKERILEAASKTPSHVVASAWMEGFFDYDTAAAAAACTVPILYIDAGTPNTNLARFSELCPQLVIGRTVGAGHFIQLEVPDQVNPMIERFLEVSKV